MNEEEKIIVTRDRDGYHYNNLSLRPYNHWLSDISWVVEVEKDNFEFYIPVLGKDPLEACLSAIEIIENKL